MNVLFIPEAVDGEFHKPALELATYAAELAKMLGGEPIALVFGDASNDSIQVLGIYGTARALKAADGKYNSFDSAVWASAAALAVEKANAGIVVCTGTFNGKALSARLAAKLGAGLVSGAAGLPHKSAEALVYRKPIFSSKGFGEFAIDTDKQVVCIGINSFRVAESENPVQVSIENLGSDGTQPKIEVLETMRSKGQVLLTEAEVVVSAGRGLRGPENWHMIEELANILGAATSCSKPVSDVGWRPHSEHVGQTGLTISPNLYIAVGISGAIQHLAGVNNSKVIAVINKDPEAPFFKSADYGIIGDAFEVLPKLIEAAKALKK